MTAYTDFVKQHISRMTGTQKEKMTQVARMWRDQKAGLAGGSSVALLTGGARRAHAYEVAESNAERVEPVKRLGRAAGLTGGRGRGGNPLAAANQLSGAGIGGNFLDIIGYPRDGYNDPGKSFLHGLAAAPILVAKAATSPVSLVLDLFK